MGDIPQLAIDLVLSLWLHKSMKTIDSENKIDRKELIEMAEKMFGSFVKAVVDVKRKIMVVDAEMHADMEASLLENGSKQQDLWGINLYPNMAGDDFIEFDSMINLRPSQGNRSRGVDDQEIQQTIIAIVQGYIKDESDSPQKS